MHLFLGTALVPLVTSFVAAMDSDHRVRLAVGDDGLTVVLSHDFSGVPGFLHEHCLVAQCLVALSSPGDSGQADHLIHFARCAQLMPRASSERWFPVPERSDAGDDAGFTSPLPSAGLPPSPLLRVCARGPDPVPPLSTAHLRTTLLVI
ncbi:MAG TPA: hypothetical protein PKW90_24930 [Myxococcota bacterium]|nr:hypothetical protein [Myxococcota bacterium]